MKENYLRGLNKEQKEAVTFKSGPLLIVAGAGTGKTTVIAKRIGYLIKKGFARPNEILGLTFSEKAAQEMEERIEDILPIGYFDLWISTFHSFGQRILKENAINIGLSSDFKVLDQENAWILIRQNLEKFNLDYYKPLGNPSKFIKAFIDHFSRLKDQGITIDEYQKYAQKIKDKEEKKRVKEISLAFKTYQNILLEKNYLDFGDLINYSLLLFKKRPHILEKYRRQFKYILIDEFQDANRTQYELIKILAAPINNLTVCADDDQAIYRWRGASFDNIIRFKKDYPKSKEIFLIKNYRSSQNILDLSYKFIQLNNPDRLEYRLSKQNRTKKINKKLISQKKDKGIIEHMHFKTQEDETRAVVEKIEEILNKKQADSFSDFAILVRANDYALPFVKELEGKEIPHLFLSSFGLYSQSVILDIIAYFRIIENRHENRSLYRILKSPILEISEQDISKISSFSKIKTISFYESLKDESLIEQLTQASKEKIKFFLHFFEKHSSTLSVSRLFLNFLNDSGYLKYLTKKEKSEEIEFLNQFFIKIKKFEEREKDFSINDFLQELDWEIESGNEGKINFNFEECLDAVKIMTVHSAKGLEFPFVFIVNLVDKRFPSVERGEEIEIPKELRKDIIPFGDAHLQEERRLFYVAMTRAKKGLFFTSASDYGGQRKKKISMFLYELGFEKTKERNLAKNNLNLHQFKRKIDKLISLPPHFSYTQIATFKKCPLQYKFAHILKIPRFGSATFSFGKTMHNVLFRFMKECYPLKKLKLDEIYKIYKQEWIDEWYESKEQKKKYYELGKKSLKSFIQELKENKPKIMFVDGNPCLETDFSLKLGPYTIKGKIDRIDDLGELKAEIIDYKTGKPKENIKQEEKEQLLIYLIAAEELLKIKPKKLSYYYIDASKKLEFLPNEKEKNIFKNKLIEQIAQIEKSDFSPTPGRICKFCDYKEICEFRKII